MLHGISISLLPSDHARLAGIALDRNSPQKHVWRVAAVFVTDEKLLVGGYDCEIGIEVPMTGLVAVPSRRTTRSRSTLFDA